MHTPPVRAAKYRPSALIAASVAAHGAALAGTLAWPRLWPWALGAVLADHLLLVSYGLVPRSQALGPNWTRLPASAHSAGHVAITFDDGPDPQVTPRVLALLEAARARATFFCIGERVRRFPALAREIVACGHTIENHSEHHPWWFSLLDPARMSTEIERAQLSIAETVGRLPRFFRAPAGLRNPFLEPLLARAGLTLTSWTRRGFDTVNRSADSVLARLAANLRPCDILLLHDAGGAQSRAGTPVVLEVLPRLLEELATRRLTPVTLADTVPCEPAAQAGVLHDAELHRLVPCPDAHLPR
jgi:peptidoglycan-N-acetylglucosamine deacetylase